MTLKINDGLTTIQRFYLRHKDDPAYKAKRRAKAHELYRKDVERQHEYKRKYRNKNKEKIKAKDLIYRIANRDKIRAYGVIWRIADNLNVSMEEARHWVQLREMGCWLCALLGLPQKSKCHADHCHKTGKPRGILCSRHNLLIGFIEKLKDGELELANMYIAGELAWIANECRNGEFKL